MLLLRVAAERAKCELANEHIATVDVALSNMEFQGNFKAKLNRFELNSIIGPLIVETMTLVKKVLTDSTTSPNKISHVFLVGGSSRLQLVHKLLTEVFNGKENLIRSHLDPDTVVAHGAAELGARLKFGQGATLYDVAPLGLGIATSKRGSIMSVSKHH